MAAVDETAAAAQSATADIDRRLNTLVSLMEQHTADLTTMTAAVNKAAAADKAAATAAANSGLASFAPSLPTTYVPAPVPVLVETSSTPALQPFVVPKPKPSTPTKCSTECLDDETCQVTPTLLRDLSFPAILSPLSESMYLLLPPMRKGNEQQTWLPCTQIKVAEDNGERPMPWPSFVGRLCQELVLMPSPFFINCHSGVHQNQLWSPSQGIYLELSIGDSNEVYWCSVINSTLLDPSCGPKASCDFVPDIGACLVSGMIELEHISLDHYLGLQIQQLHPFAWVHNHELITAFPLEKPSDPTVLRTAVMNFSHYVLHCCVTWDMPWDPGVIANFLPLQIMGTKQASCSGLVFDIDADSKQFCMTMVTLQKNWADKSHFHGGSAMNSFTHISPSLLQFFRAFQIPWFRLLLAKLICEAEVEDPCLSTQLIDGDGVFIVSGLESFMKQVKLAECGLSYVLVSVMDPRSSGKSTLLNHLFRTNFREMDVFRGRSQTTKGIWLAKAQNIEPCTLVMDLEGTDGRERGEDDTAFERQSALFALAVSDIVLINMWCHEIGREQAANKPLLKIVFQAMMRLSNPRKTTMLFVIRDKSKTPLENLQPILREDIQNIWDGVPKPHTHKDTPLSEFFNVQVVALNSFQEKEELFKEQVSSLRDRFQHSITPGGLAGDRRDVVPASGFSFSSEQFWNVIKENKDLDLPAHKVMVATLQCEEIGNEKVASFAADEEWHPFEEAVQSDYVPSFGKKMSILLDRCLSEYDMEAIYFDEAVRTSKRHQLESKLLQLVNPAYQSLLGQLRTRTLEAFKESFDKAVEKEGFAVAVRDSTWIFLQKFDNRSEDASIQQVNWDPSKVKDKFKIDIEAHVVSVRATKLSILCATYKGKLTNAPAEHLEALLDSVSEDTWPAIRKLLQQIIAYSQLASMLWDPGGSSRRPAWGQAGFQGRGNVMDRKMGGPWWILLAHNGKDAATKGDRPT